MAGKRTIITLTEKDKVWLENYSKVYRISVAEAIRKGISCLRNEKGKTTYQLLIQKTKGIWEKGDGLEYQKRLRSEWS